MWPMLLGLRPLLGDGVYGSSTSRTGGSSEYGATGQSVWLSRGAARSDQLTRTGAACSAADAGAPVAVLIGPWTMSSGEIVAAALAKRQPTRRFGEPTAGLATATEPIALADGSTLTIATEAIRDALGQPLPGAILPDHAVSWGDWPTADDAAVRAALAWLNSQPLPQPHGTQEPSR